ncbi:MAG: hypothetical protein KatS3mg095_0651 [Candidatus Parcubacteria bacterium]|nr:MAG: hypothetical protein KatS3mg095_0651 [Candidatus Parcubacteria bacterium]
MGNKMNMQLRNISEDDFFNLKNNRERIKFLLNYAVLAPSTHNSQPWLFKIKNNSCEIYKNEKLILPYADPIQRDLYISLGCCLENLVLASKYFNVYDNLEYVIKDNLVAIVHFNNLTSSNFINDDFKIFIEGIKKRFNARGVFLTKEIPEELLKQIESLNDFNELEILFLKDKTKIEKVARLISKGLEIAYMNKEFRKEMSRWIINNLSTKKYGIPGYALKMPLLVSFIFPYLIRFFNIGKKLGYLNYLSVKSAPSSCLISAAENSPLIWCKVGQLAERIMVYLAAHDVQISIFVSAIEMGLDKELAEIFGTNLTPQFHFCIGYISSKHKYTPRYAPQEKLLENKNNG